MKNQIVKPLPVFFLLLVLLNFGSIVWAAELTVRIENQPSAGNVVFVLFNSKNTFGDLRDPIKVVVQSIDGSGTYRIQNVPPGEHALLVYYDENNNARLDRNFMGIPKEPLGYSNGYQPKGPPSYSRAVFFLAENQSSHFDVKLYRPLGKFGRLGVGLGVIAQTSPYRDYSGGIYQVIPAISYSGNRFQIYGPRAQVSIAGSGILRFAATGQYRIGAYEEDKSDFLEGMGDRKSTFMAGLALQVELPGGVDLSASYAHDVLDKIGGGEARIEFDKSFQIGVFRFIPQIGMQWLSSKIANYDFGVPTSKVTPNRPAFSLDAAISLEGGMGIFLEITPDWLVALNTSVKFLDGEVTKSPIISEDFVINGFVAFNYLF